LKKTINFQKSLYFCHYTEVLKKNQENEVGKIIYKNFNIIPIKRLKLRIDKFLNAVNIVKRRAIATEMLDEGVVFVNGKKAKKSKEIKIDDIIEIKYLNGSKKYKVLKLPESKTIPKSKKDEYVKEIKWDFQDYFVIH